MTIYYQCVSCTKTSEQQHCIIKTDGNLICPHCLDAVKFAFVLSSWTAITQGESEPSLGYCDGCDELEAELHLMDGDWLCDKCKATVIAVQEDKAKAKENKTMVEAVGGPQNKLHRPLGDDQSPCIHHYIYGLGLLCRVG